MQKAIPTYIHWEDQRVDRYYDRTFDEIRDEFFVAEEIGLHLIKGGPAFVVDPCYESAMYEDGAYHIYLRQVIPTPDDLED